VASNVKEGNVKKLQIFTPLVILFCFTVGCQQDEVKPLNPLMGIWKVAETATIDPEGQLKNPYEHSSLYIFQDDYYFMVMVLGDEPRTEFVDPWDPTDDEKIEAYNSILVNAGIYEQKNSVIITRPIIARVPNFVGGEAYYEYKIEGNTLTLTWFDEVSKTGVPHPWVGKLKFQRTLIRIK